MGSRLLRTLLVIAAALLGSALGGCASVPESFEDSRDPWESYNRGMYSFNDNFDKAFAKPIAKGYNKILPTPVNKGVTNFFNNLDDVTSAVNNLLQFKLQRTATDIGRVAVNTTVGILGVIDVAGNLNLPSYKEDFGQTLGYWGVGPGPYFVLPLLGPSTVRDAVGLVAAIFTNPMFYFEESQFPWGLVVLRAIDRRAGLLAASRVLEEAALDPYDFTKEAYLQKREFDVYDGNPPLEDEGEFEDFDQSPSVPESAPADGSAE